jgi:hypothetical protein
VERLNQALQKVVLAEMTTADLRGKDVVFTRVMGRMVSEDVAKALSGATAPNGHTGGIWIRAATVER